MATVTFCSFSREHLPAIDVIHPFAGLQIRHHGGIPPDNVLCALDGDKLVGVGALIHHRGIRPKGLHKMDFFTHWLPGYRKDRSLDALLLERLIRRFHKIREEHPAERLCLRTCPEDGALGDMQFYLDQGFRFSAVIPVLKYDLAREIDRQPVPDGISIERLILGPETVRRYLEADFAASDLPEGEADLWFMSGDPSFACFAARDGDAVVGAASIWDITAERSATENIFVVPGYRRKNIARALIATALGELKSRGRQLATLSVMGDNLPAIRLYRSLGYEYYCNLLEMTVG